MIPIQERTTMSYIELAFCIGMLFYYVRNRNARFVAYFLFFLAVITERLFEKYKVFSGNKSMILIFLTVLVMVSSYTIFNFLDGKYPGWRDNEGNKGK